MKFPSYIFLFITVDLVKNCIPLNSYFSAIPELDNKIGTAHLLHETSASSSSVCGAMCRNNCNCFGYNRLQKQCRLHVFCEYIDMITTATGWQYYRAASDCMVLYQNGQTTSGVYSIHPKEGARTDVVCDMETMGGGWTITQNRFDGSVNFTRNWIDYKVGFGTAHGEYWIGNEALHQLTTTDVNSLYVSITLNNGSNFFEHFETFSISSELDNYRLSVGGQASGTLGNRINTPDNPGSNINGMMFSSPDRDNDRHGHASCAQDGKGGWWFNVCHDAYLNGPYGSSSWNEPWSPPLSTGETIQETTMMIRRR
ncbi:ryncolin-4-like [Crassostrea virginica]